MRRALFITVIILTLLVSGFFIFRAWLRQGEMVSYPEIRFQGEQGIVIRTEIHKDESFQPLKIILRSEKDMHRALGFAQGLIVGDRMNFLRLCTRSELSRYFGPEYAAADQYLKDWHFRDLASETMGGLNDETREQLDLFVQGINQRFSQIPPPSGCQWYNIEEIRWTPEDVLAIWHLLRWSQLETWPISFMVRFADIYYGRQVKEQFETVLNHKIPEFFETVHIRSFIDVYHLDRQTREIVGLIPLLREQSEAGFLIYGYSGSQNEDWLEFVLEKDSVQKRIIQHAGLPLIFAGDRGAVIPHSCDFVPLTEIDPSDMGRTAATYRLIPSPQKEPGPLTDRRFQIPVDLFDRNGHVFSHLMTDDSLDKELWSDFSYTVLASGLYSHAVPAMIKSRSVRELEKEIRRLYPENPHLSEIVSSEDAVLWGIFVAKLLNDVYRDDLQVIHPVFNDWPGEYPQIFIRHLLMIMKNPYSAWWDYRETPDTVERMDYNFARIAQDVLEEYKSGERAIRIYETERHPLSRFHVLTGSYRDSSKDIKTPLLLKYRDGMYIYDRFLYIPGQVRDHQKIR